MPFEKVFDVAYSIGVLHHLPQPQEGFSRLPKVLKKDGHMLIWVYNRRGNARAIYFYEPLRAVLKQLPKPVLYKLCYIPGGAVHAINGVTHGLRAVGAKKLAQKVPFAYYANFPFNMKLNDAFDVLATPKSNYYYREQVEGWFNASGLKHIRSYEHPEAGITCFGIR
jgi:SAM-dependent methyltransferase